MKTYSAKPSDIKRTWHIIDASEANLGRISTVAASLLIGKKKPAYTPHIDSGDHVIIVNADKFKVSGNKLEKKIYYRHTGYPGGIKSLTLKEKMDKDSTSVIEAAVRGMLPVNKLRAGRLARLRVYAGDQHNHAAQKPQKVDIKG